MEFDCILYFVQVFTAADHRITGLLFKAVISISKSTFMHHWVNFTKTPKLKGHKKIIFW